MEALATALLLWINRHSDYPMEGITPPAIVLWSPEEITAEYYSENRNLIPVSGIDDRVLALYDFRTDEKGIVYLRVAELALNNTTALDELKKDPIPNRNFWAHVYSRC